ncbi:hypothetical protein L3X38_033150 [Prunus dulcis]|uniref:Reverse transcriptase RNase H-like domain-containing protein n=1 Tax=Prunus dulcis TaxID=3755 RepID=A0AAD4VHR5_PRUDU|nr:hypothetical protein L3X38_033150 [Prunus dulcis]
MRAPIPGLPLKLYLAVTNAVVGALLAQDDYGGEESPIYYLIVKSNPVRYWLTRPALSGRLARWLLQLSEFDIMCTTPKAIKGQSVIDMLALFPEVEESILLRKFWGSCRKWLLLLKKKNHGPFTLMGLLHRKVEKQV